MYRDEADVQTLSTDPVLILTHTLMSLSQLLVQIKEKTRLEVFGLRHAKRRSVNTCSQVRVSESQISFNNGPAIELRTGSYPKLYIRLKQLARLNQLNKICISFKLLYLMYGYNKMWLKG